MNIMENKPEKNVDKFCSSDNRRELIIHDHLYGRDKELEVLMKVFHQVSQGSTELILINGDAGIGKTELVNKIRKPIAKKNSFFISGKYNQFKQNTPYHGIIQAFQELIVELSNESETEQEKWKNKLFDKLGHNAQIIINMIPELENIIGEQPPGPKLDSEKPLERFQIVFKDFIEIFVNSQHPLVIFLDDLQWIDTASLNLIEKLLVNWNINNLMLIGVYRDKEVGTLHQLSLTLNKIEEDLLQISSKSCDFYNASNRKVTEPKIINRIFLLPLDLSNVRQLILDTLNYPLESQIELLDSIMKKTNGNPFFIKQILKYMYKNNLFKFNGTKGWVLSPDFAKKFSEIENIKNFLNKRISELQPAMREVLTIAACIGNRFEIKTLAGVHKMERDELTKVLTEAIEDELVYDCNDHLAFAHDYIHEAVYNLIGKKEKANIHLDIGRLMLNKIIGCDFLKEFANLSLDDIPEKLRENIFIITDHMNHGYWRITDQNEKHRMARLNLWAGKKAKLSGAYDKAYKYLRIGKRFQGKDSWKNQFNLTFIITLEGADCAYLNVIDKKAEKLFKEMLENVDDKLRKMEIYKKMIIMYTKQDKSKEAVELGITGLESLGQSINIFCFRNAIPVLYGCYFNTKMMIKKINNLPDMKDPIKIAVMELLEVMITPAYRTSRFLVIQIAFLMFKLSIKYGKCAATPMGFVVFGVFLGHLFLKNSLGRKLGKIGIQLSDEFKDKFQNVETKNKVNSIFGAMLNHWKKPAKENIPYLDAVYINAIQYGDILFASYTLTNLIESKYISGDRLDSVYGRIKKSWDFAKMIKHKNLDYCLTIMECAILDLKNLSHSHLIKCVENIINDIINKEGDSEFNQILYLYYAFQLEKFFMYGNYKDVLNVAKKTKICYKNSFGFMITLNYYFYYPLALIADYPSLSIFNIKGKISYLTKIYYYQIRLKLMGKSCPENFLHKYKLFSAEKARIFNKHNKAIKYYAEAIELAKENGYTQIAALGNELAAGFYKSLGDKKSATAYMQDARDLYREWGAVSKVMEIESAYPDLIETVDEQECNQSTDSGSLDFIDKQPNLITMIKQSRFIPKDTILKQLLDKSIQTIGVLTGAESGFFVLNKNDKLFIEAKWTINEGVEGHTDPIPVNGSDQGIPYDIIKHVIETKESVMLGDATSEGNFILNHYVINNQPLSILCIPALNNVKLWGALYLENSKEKNIFDIVNCKTTKVMLSQVEVNFENLKHYYELGRLKGEISERKMMNDEILRIEERERQKLGNDIHDSFGQILTAAMYQSTTLTKILEQRQAEESGKSANVTKTIGTALKLVKKFRRSIWLYKEGVCVNLKSELEVLAKKTQTIFNIPCSFNGDEDFKVVDTKMIHLYRITQEAVNNAIQHANAKSIKIILESDINKSILMVIDDGKGFCKTEQETKGSGLEVMGYRASLIGACLEIDSKPDNGTIISCTFETNKLTSY